MALRVVTVDLWNTILGAAGSQQRQEQRLRRLQAYVERLGMERSEQELREAFRQMWRYYTAVWWGQQRTPTPQELTTFLWQWLKLPEEPAIVAQLAEEMAIGILESPPPLLPYARQALEWLAERYRLALVSDTAFSPGSVLRELLRQYDIAELFAAFSFSDETGVAKPHPRAYRVVLDKLDTAPEEALHIGDLEPTDIQGAKGLRMSAILFLGDLDSEFSPPAQTLADAIAYHWQQVPELVERLSCCSR
ncbi:MAG: HAD family hydrolase [Candidatus Kapabacteria bacterium]|nr:HAD family hydrolase [Candidatus Kapabacteria bacterium]MDW8011621.1 HAD family hydrolase [Bacteroidota bacterium]